MNCDAAQVFFFFQAEDGIRDLVRSRGLGDVYKRQVPEIAGGHHEKLDGTGYPRRLDREQLSPLARMMAVSYTHLTLPTSDLV